MLRVRFVQAHAPGVPARGREVLAHRANALRTHPVLCQWAAIFRG